MYIIIIIITDMYNCSLFLFFVASVSQNKSAKCSDGSVKLGMNLTSGRLEVCVNNAWGSVCSYGFSERAATVACASLGGYSGESMLLHDSGYIIYM